MTHLSSIETLSDGSVLSVATLAALPNVVSNIGSLVYVVAENKYYYSDGVTWNINYSSSDATTYITYAWGSNSSGRLGDGTTVSKSSPVTVVGGITNWSQLFAGNSSNLALTSTGIAYAWGVNASGQLGDGTTSNRSSPVTVIGGITNWSQLSVGTSHCLGVTSTGIAYAWGYNTYGGLGDNTATNRSSPVTVVGGLSWSRVSAGLRYSLGVTTTGIAYAWGQNTSGILADGTTTSRSSPVTVVGGITNWSQLSAGFTHVLGLTSSGIAYAWGNASNGRLGDGTAVTKYSPVSVVGGITNWTQVSAGQTHSLGLTSTGIAYAWGTNSSGELGDGTFTSRSSPVTVIGGITNWSQVSTSGFGTHNLGLTTTGIAYAWGNNTYGKLGVGDTASNRTSPVTVVGGITNWSRVSAGGDHSLGIVTIPKGF